MLAATSGSVVNWLARCELVCVYACMGLFVSAVRTGSVVNWLAENALVYLHALMHGLHGILLGAFRHAEKAQGLAKRSLGPNYTFDTDRK